MFESSRLGEEARKGWNYFVTDSLVYSSEILNGYANPFFLISKEHFGLRHWLELDVSFVGDIENHLQVVIEFLDLERFGARGFEIILGDRRMKRDVSMFVDIPERVQNPKELSLIRVPNLVWLKGPNCSDGFFGNSKSSPGEGDLVL